MSMYWSGHNLLTRNAMFNFVVGGRGTGKTFYSVSSRIRHFIKTGKTFIYLRRYKSEFDDKNLFFNAVADEFPQWEFKVEGMAGYMRHKVIDDAIREKWRLCVHFIRLSNAVTKKSVPYPDVDYIVFDEFILDAGNIHYIKNEAERFLDFYNTVDRFTDRVRVLFLANSVSIVNPYFLYYNIRPEKGKQYTLCHDGYIAIENVKSEQFQKHINSTRFGKMIAGTAYSRYAVDNKFRDDTDTFIARKTENARFYFAIMFDGCKVGVWVDYEYGIYYISNRVPTDGLVYALTRSDMQPNLQMIERSSTVLKSVRKLYMQGMVYFDSVQTREFFNDVFNFINLR